MAPCLPKRWLLPGKAKLFLCRMRPGNKFRVTRFARDSHAELVSASHNLDLINSDFNKFQSPFRGLGHTIIEVVYNLLVTVSPQKLFLHDLIFEGIAWMMLKKIRI